MVTVTALFIVPGILAHMPGRSPEAHALYPITDDPSRRTPMLIARSESRIRTIEYGPARHHGVEEREGTSLVRESLDPSGLSPEPMRAHARAEPAKRCAGPSFGGIDLPPWPWAFRRWMHPSRSFVGTIRADGCPQIAKGCALVPSFPWPSGRMNAGIKAKEWRQMRVWLEP
jgi:hypothetical protein